MNCVWLVVVGSYRFDCSARSRRCLSGVSGFDAGEGIAKQPVFDFGGVLFHSSSPFGESQEILRAGGGSYD